MTSTVLPYRYLVADRHPETADTVTLNLEPIDEPLPGFAPGQFAMLTAFGVGEVPISVSGRTRSSGPLEHTLRAVGPVTTALYGSRPGDVLGVRGPFGMGWNLPAARHRDLVLIAGGIGLAPLRPVLLTALAEPAEYGAIVVLVGARTPADLLYGRELEALPGRSGMHVGVTVDRAENGWRGHIGVVTTLLDYAPFDPNDAVAMVCGPELMMRFTAESLERRGVPTDRIQISLERNMRCGVGHCGHCQLGPLLLCRDGPVVGYDRAASLLIAREL
jgi:anaerobic sulfite reductase subunit B